MAPTPEVSFRPLRGPLAQQRCCATSVWWPTVTFRPLSEALGSATSRASPCHSSLGIFPSPQRDPWLSNSLADNVVLKRIVLSVPSAGPLAQQPCLDRRSSACRAAFRPLSGALGSATRRSTPTQPYNLSAFRPLSEALGSATAAPWPRPGARARPSVPSAGPLAQQPVSCPKAGCQDNGTFRPLNGALGSATMLMALPPNVTTAFPSPQRGPWLGNRFPLQCSATTSTLSVPSAGPLAQQRRPCYRAAQRR